MASRKLHHSLGHDPRKKGKDRATPARLWLRTLQEGRREDKFAALAAIGLGGDGWQEGPSAWRAPFLRSAQGAWADFPTLESLFVYNGSGVMPGRTWVIAPDAQSLAHRWDRLIRESESDEK